MHSGPLATSTHPQPVWVDVPLAKTSYGRQVRPSGQLPSQVGWPVPPVHGIGGGKPSRQTSTSPSTAATVPAHVPLVSAFAIAATNLSSALCRHVASTSVPARMALLTHTA